MPTWDGTVIHSARTVSYQVTSMETCLLYQIGVGTFVASVIRNAARVTTHFGTGGELKMCVDLLPYMQNSVNRRDALKNRKPKDSQR